MEIELKTPNWWGRRTKLERCLTLINILALIAVIGLIIGLVSVILSKQTAEGQQDSRLPPTVFAAATGISTDAISKGVAKSTVCMTPECLHAASAILKKLKPGVEPCDDFYQFACGSFIEKEIIPEDRPLINTMSEIENRLQEQLRDIVTEERPATDPKYLHIPNKLYKACMNKTRIEALGAQPIRKIAESIGDWPVIKGDDWDLENKWTWEEATKDFRRFGFSMDYIVDFTRGEDLKNTTKHVLDLDQTFLGLGREYLVKGFNETLVSAYYDYMVDTAVLFGADRGRALKELRESLQFEMDLANITLPDEKRRDANSFYNIYTISQLQEKYPYVQWLDYINALLPAYLKVDEDELINVSAPGFYNDLGPVLAKAPKRAIANYMMWRIHSFAVPFLSDAFRKRHLEYMTAVHGIQEQEDRWKECVDFASGSTLEEFRDGLNLPLTVGSLYVRKHFNEDSKAIALEMVNNIRAAFSTILDGVSWMDAQTKQEAQKKLKAMATHIGYPDELLDNNKLAAYYDKLEIDEEHYFQSFLNINILVTDYAFSKLRVPMCRNDWEQHARPAVINAFYGLTQNSIEFPAGILQGHFFNAHRPQYMNYGGIGYVMGHEITHGFDDQGRQFDEEGNLKDWWTPDVEEAFLEKARCIIEQYGNYTDRATGLKLNGINTQGENIADNGGVKEAYLAYRRWAAQHGPEPKLPGLDYTPEQLFWISAGQTWCVKYRKETLKNIIEANSHAPGQFRVLGPLSNRKEFSDAFQCPEGSPMNPTHKCEVW